MKEWESQQTVCHITTETTVNYRQTKLEGWRGYQERPIITVVIIPMFSGTVIVSS
jgi:hypothetical protein